MGAELPSAWPSGYLCVRQTQPEGKGARQPTCWALPCLPRPGVGSRHRQATAPPGLGL